MQQYHRMKAEHPDALLFFRMGDFYELFFEDAVVAAKALEIALTSRSKDKDGNPVPMCGVPYHAASAYIARLVRQGFRVALCEQMEDPRTAKGVVKREVVRVITPGTQLEASALDAAETSFVMAVEPGPASLGVAWLEPTTGEFFAAEWDGPAPLRPPARRDRRHPPPRDPGPPRSRAARLALGSRAARGGDPARPRRGPRLRARARPPGAPRPLRRGHPRGLRLRGPRRAPSPPPGRPSATCGRPRSATSPT